MNDGDVELFLSLVERHRRYLYNLALRIDVHVGWCVRRSRTTRGALATR
jgi:hypothetical protein